ncbi:MAG: M1 family aminopeptidase [Bacteroidales bacterium]|nr:M1 family aminopeptidase [Bacteroidales bacterium]
MAMNAKSLTKIWPLLLLLYCTQPVVSAQDTLDVLHYDLKLDLGRTAPRKMYGDATLRLRLLGDMENVCLDLEHTTVDSLHVNGAVAPFTYDDRSLCFATPAGVSSGDVLEVEVFYHTSGRVESSGFGGLHLDAGIYYNLGVGFVADPNPYGRSMFPCRDNFTDKATYALSVTTAPGWTALCSGQRDSVTLHADGSAASHWTLHEPIPTYLLSVSAAPFSIWEDTVQGAFASYPFRAGFRGNDTAAVTATFALLPNVMTALENCFGPYRWHTIGYVATPRGSMEHANNIHLVEHCVSSMDLDCQSVVAHELAHAWFGNLVTAASSHDMWFNEGGASFCEEIAMEAAYGGDAGKAHYKANLLLDALNNAHLRDGGYIPLYAPEHENTYGTTIYKKGACVWHSLRSYLGDSLFYASMRRLFADEAFGHVGTADLMRKLSEYSGVDLADFFAFNVYGRGWQDFNVQLSGNGVELRQSLRGGDVLGNGCKVPVTFFSDDLQTRTVTYCMDGAYLKDETRRAGEGSPYAFAVVDLEKRFSYASLADTVRIAARGDYRMDNLHFKAKAQRVGAATAFLAVTHHYTAPPIDQVDSLSPYVRFAQHYWTVTGLLPGETQCYGFFDYSLNDLDRGLYQPNLQSFDSVRLLYRPSASAPWRVVGKRSDGTSTSGYFYTTNLKKGEYTFAVVDTAILNRLSLSQSAAYPSPQLFPNPAGDSFRVVAPVPYDLCMTDLTGRCVLQRHNVQPNETILHGLPAGTYVVTLSGAFGTSHMKLLVQ